MLRYQHSHCVFTITYNAGMIVEFRMRSELILIHAGVVQTLAQQI